MGGFDLAAEWMGWDNIFHCEWNPFGQRILKYYWPKAISYNDITKTDFSIHRGAIDILTGGFPCQPYSTAGKRKGKDDERHLWPHMLRALREIRPSYVVGENVRGLVNWSKGLVFDEIQSDLEAEGFDVTPFILPACGVNAPHRRERVWFIAHSNSNGLHRCNCEHEEHTSKGRQYAFSNTCKSLEYGVTSNADSLGSQRWKSTSARKNPVVRNDWGLFPTQPPICNGNDGISSRLDNITFSEWRTESIKAGGNAIVPQVALQIFQAIQQYEKICG